MKGQDGRYIIIVRHLFGQSTDRRKKEKAKGREKSRKSETRETTLL